MKPVLLFFLLLLLPLLMAADWPKGANGGLELARTYCQREDATGFDAMVFEFEEDGETILFHATCFELLRHLAELDRVDARA